MHYFLYSRPRITAPRVRVIKKIIAGNHRPLSKIVEIHLPGGVTQLSIGLIAVVISMGVIPMTPPKNKKPPIIVFFIFTAPFLLIRRN